MRSTSRGPIARSSSADFASRSAASSCPSTWSPCFSLLRDFFQKLTTGPSQRSGARPGCQKVDTEIGAIEIAPPGREAAGRFILSVRPEHVQINPAVRDGDLKATVETVIFLGFYQDVEVRLGSRVIQARTHPSLVLTPGQHVGVTIDPACWIPCR